MSSAQSLATVSLKVEPESIRAYAELTDDFNPIHLDPVFAAATPMGGVIAHGTMSICLLWQMLERNLGSAAFAAPTLDVRFLKPVREGEVLTAGGALNTDDPAMYDVWVRGSDGGERVVGTVRLGTNTHTAREEGSSP